MSDLTIRMFDASLLKCPMTTHPISNPVAYQFDRILRSILRLKEGERLCVSTIAKIDQEPFVSRVDRVHIEEDLYREALTRLQLSDGKLHIWSDEQAQVEELSSPCVWLEDGQVIHLVFNHIEWESRPLLGRRRANIIVVSPIWTMGDSRVVDGLLSHADYERLSP